MPAALKRQVLITFQSGTTRTAPEKTNSRAKCSFFPQWDKMEVHRHRSRSSMLGRIASGMPDHSVASSGRSEVDEELPGLLLKKGPGLVAG